MADLENRANPLLLIREEYKKKPAFNRYHSERYMRVKESWRVPRGLDNRMRKKHRGLPSRPGKRYGTPAILRDLLPNGLREVVVRNVADLEALTSVNRRYCATIEHSVGARKRVEIINQALLLGIHVTNSKARLMEAISE
ncbi:large subunit ribosomal protein L32e [Pancytospora philotis]|nr:large subunit ribosomal protein L32e [Pancytospora philotis]